MNFVQTILINFDSFHHAKVGAKNLPDFRSLRRKLWWREGLGRGGWGCGSGEKWKLSNEASLYDASLKHISFAGVWDSSNVWGTLYKSVSQDFFLGEEMRFLEGENQRMKSWMRVWDFDGFWREDGEDIRSKCSIWWVFWLGNMSDLLFLLAPGAGGGLGEWEQIRYKKDLWIWGVCVLMVSGARTPQWQKFFLASVIFK